MEIREANKDAVVGQVADIARRVGAAEGIEVVGVEFKGAGRQRLLRIFIDKPEGVSLSDCEFVSKQVGTILDVDDVIPGASYTLQVSSPGLERPLKGAADFERFVGRRAKIVLREPIGARRYWEGTLAGCAGGVVTLEPPSGEPVRIALEMVDRANLKFEW
jgi:ribosome maturation factor RimP